VTPVTPPIPTISVTNFLAFGDSLTEGEWWPGLQYYDPALTNAWPTFLLASLQARYTNQTFVMANDALGGYRAADDVASGRFINSLNSRKPQVVLLLQGVNDLFDNPTPGGVDTLIKALREDIRNAKSRNIAVFISTLTAERDPNPGGIDDPGFKPRHWIIDSLLVQANAAIKTMAAAEGATVVDGYAITVADPNHMIGADGLHLTIDGYKALAAAFFTAVKAQYEVPAAQAPPTTSALLSIR
jgi:lysophospholipase L1-like esterase